MHRLMGEFDRRLPRLRRSPFGCDGLMVCSPRLGDHLFVSLIGSYIWHNAALDQFRALYGVAMERGGVRRPLSLIVRIRNSGRMADRRPHRPLDRTVARAEPETARQVRFSLMEGLKAGEDGDPRSLRVSDRDRDRTVGRLKDALSEGLIDIDEFGERTSRAFARAHAR